VVTPFSPPFPLHPGPRPRVGQCERTFVSDPHSCVHFFFPGAHRETLNGTDLTDPAVDALPSPFSLSPTPGVNGRESPGGERASPFFPLFWPTRAAPWGAFPPPPFFFFLSPPPAKVLFFPPPQAAVSSQQPRITPEALLFFFGGSGHRYEPGVNRLLFLLSLE